ncbi:MAG: lysophospholipid acyltransferase family protein [Verrucomicrobiota bacterium]
MGRVAGIVGRGLLATTRGKVIYECEGPEVIEPRVICLWHNRILGGSSSARTLLPHRQAVVLTSASKDGAVLEAAIGCFGLGSVRGSSSRRGAAALVALKREIEAGRHVCITPDGPRGPRYRVQPGAVKLASITGAPLVPVRVIHESFWELKTWDGFQIPKPFSRVAVTFGQEIEVPRELREEELVSFQKRLEEAMGESQDLGRDDDH